MSSTKNIVKVMNFHALLRVNDARKKVEKAFNYERELKYVIATIVNNRIFNQENLSLDFSKNEKELNIYIGSDLGFCSSFNFDVMSYLKEDLDENDKIIIGKRVDCDVPNKKLYIDKEKFHENQNKIYEIIKKSKYPVILTGDFNLTTSSPKFRMFIENLEEIGYKRIPNAELTWKYQKEKLPIDHIFIPKDWKIEEYKISKDKYMENFSDHYPLLVKISK